MLWFFFETGHGKGEHDGAGAVVKRALQVEQLIIEQMIIMRIPLCPQRDPESIA